MCFNPPISAVRPVIGTEKSVLSSFSLLSFLGLLLYVFLDLSSPLSNSITPLWHTSWYRVSGAMSVKKYNHKDAYRLEFNRTNYPDYSIRLNIQILAMPQFHLTSTITQDRQVKTIHTNAEAVQKHINSPLPPVI